LAKRRLHFGEASDSSLSARPISRRKIEQDIFKLVHRKQFGDFGGRVTVWEQELYGAETCVCRCFEPF
jgi:hypothetical protein